MPISLDPEVLILVSAELRTNVNNGLSTPFIVPELHKCGGTLTNNEFTASNIVIAIVCLAIYA
jgi:hypothetical protein